jgi:hypothetical protein
MDRIEMKEPRTQVNDVEKGSSVGTPEIEHDFEIAEVRDVPHKSTAFLRRIVSWGVEAEGIVPIPEENRTNMRTYEIFTLWFSMSTNLLP